MPFSSGTFSLYSPGNPVVEGTDIEADWGNNTLNDIATGLSTAILKDGSQTITANIPFSGFKITGLGLGTSLTDSARMSQVQDQVGSNLTNVAGTNTITALASITPAYAVGQRFTFTPAVTNTGATTINISSVGAGAVQWAGAALTGGELVAGTPVTVSVTAATPVFEIVGATQFPDTRALVVGGTDATKKVRFEVDSLTTATTRVVNVPDRDLTISDPPTLGTPQTTVADAAKNFTGIPSWVKRITIMLSGVSTTGTSDYIIQIGDSGGIETSGYLSGATRLTNAAAVVVGPITTGFALTATPNAGSIIHGSIILTMMNSSAFTWNSISNLWDSGTGQMYFGAGTMSLTAALDRLSFTTVGGSDTFDAGSINILYD